MPTKKSKPAAAARAGKPAPQNARAATKAENFAKAAKAVGAVADKKKKSKSSFWDVLSGAAKIAAELAPMIAPVLLASHGPTQQRLALSAYGSKATTIGKSIAQAVPSMGSFPLNASMAVQPMSGVYLHTPVYDQASGKMVGVRIIGVDYLGGLEAAVAKAQGEVLSKIDLNPYSPGWSGTRLQMECRLYERYKFVRLVGLYAPSCPATTAGQIISYIDTDPVDQMTSEGAEADQVASAHAGAETGQVFTTVLASYVADSNTQDFYGDANGSDERQVSPGNWYIESMGELDVGVYGSLFVEYEIELKLPQIENDTSMWYVQLIGGTDNVTGTTTTYPFGTNTGGQQFQRGNFRPVYAASAATDPPLAKSAFTDLPPGNYFCEWRAQAAGSLTGVTFSVDGDNYIQTNPSGTTTTTAANGMFELFVTKHTGGDFALGWLGVLTTGSAVTDIFLWISSRPSGSLQLQGKSLQEVEKDAEDARAQVDRLNERIAEITGTVEQLKALYQQTTGYELAPPRTTTAPHSLISHCNPECMGNSTAVSGAQAAENLTRNLPAQPPVLDPSDPLPHACTDCNRRYATAAALEQHRTASHSSTLPATALQPVDGGVECTTCLRRFATMAALMQHLSITHVYTEVMPAVCANCGLRFSSEAALSQHRRYFHLETQGGEEATIGRT